VQAGRPEEDGGKHSTPSRLVNTDGYNPHNLRTTFKVHQSPSVKDSHENLHKLRKSEKHNTKIRQLFSTHISQEDTHTHTKKFSL
jgi:hypothetical protein